LSDTGKAEWKIVWLDGDPNRSGDYLCVVIYPEHKDVRTGVMLADVDIRYYSEVSHQWPFCVGCHYQEHVYAWTEMPKYPKSALPGGVSLADDEHFTE